MRCCFATLPLLALLSFAALPARAATPSLQTASEVLTGRPTARELLQRFAEEQAKLNSFVAQYEYDRLDSISGSQNRKETHGNAGETRFDGRRCSTRDRLWGQIAASPRLKDKPYYMSQLFDGQWYFQYDQPYWRLEDVPKGVPGGTLRLRSGPELLSHLGTASDTSNTLGRLQVCGSPLVLCLGVPSGCDKRFDAPMRDATSLRARGQLEPAGAEPSPCYVLEADTPQGRYVVWLDPTRGFQMARLLFERLPGHQRLVGGRSHTLTTGEHDLSTVDNVRFSKTDGVWVLVAASVGQENTIPRVVSSSMRLHLKVTKFLLNPDHDTLHSFRPDDIRNGSSVFIASAAGPSGGQLTYRWRDGKVLDSSGKVAFDSGLARTNSVNSTPGGKK